MRQVRKDCPAKLNLFLEIEGLRPDGYHQLSTVMVPIDLCDTLEIRPARSFSLEIQGIQLEGRNTVEKAYEAVARHREIPPVQVRLIKRIPTGTGLGGGSSDAASMIEALDELFDLGLDRPEVGAEVGSDVNFFFAHGPALCTGRGEIVASLPSRRKLDFALLFPPFPNPTRAVYELYRKQTATEHRNVTDFLYAFESRATEDLGKAFFNRLENAAFELHPELRAWLARLGPGARMTGSGSALFQLNGTIGVPVSTY
jgi:4-diphosphocytidyl-2-C-methyl-D-erythritol kinase